MLTQQLITPGTRRNKKFFKDQQASIISPPSALRTEGTTPASLRISMERSCPRLYQSMSSVSTKYKQLWCPADSALRDMTCSHSEAASHVYTHISRYNVNLLVTVFYLCRLKDDSSEKGKIQVYVQRRNDLNPKCKCDKAFI